MVDGYVEKESKLARKIRRQKRRLTFYTDFTKMEDSMMAHSHEIISFIDPQAAANAGPEEYFRFRYTCSDENCDQNWSIQELDLERYKAYTDPTSNEIQERIERVNHLIMTVQGKIDFLNRVNG